MLIDFCSFTFKLNDKPKLSEDDLDFDFTPDEAELTLKDAIQTILTQCFDLEVSLLIRKKGLFNYAYSYEIITFVGSEDSYESVSLGLAAFGGNNDTAYVSISGTGCTMLDFEMLYEVLQFFKTCKITRLDIAEDFKDNQYTFDYFTKAYTNLLFKSNMSRVNPKNQLIGDFLTPDCPSGRTLYIGDRKSSKFCRIYEKGKQLNDPDRSWIRFEIEFKSVDKAFIPLSSLVDYEALFLNAYPICQDLNINKVDKVLKIQHKKKDSINGIDLQIKNVQRQYGQFINFLIKHTDIDLKELSRPGVSKKFKECLLFEI